MKAINALIALACLLLFQQNIVRAHNSGKWVELKPTGVPPAGEVYHSAAAVGETLYVCGGSSNHNHTHYYDITYLRGDRHVLNQEAVPQTRWFETSNTAL